MTFSQPNLPLSYRSGIYRGRRHTSRFGRRSLLGGGAAVALLVACGRSAIAPGPDPVANLPAVVPGPSGIAPSTGISPPLPTPQIAVPIIETRATVAPTAPPAIPTVAVPAASPTPVRPVALAPTAATVPATATAVPATATTVPTAVPTAVPTDTPVPTATPLTFNAGRLTDVLARGQTSYAGSIPPRRHNVELATKRLNGAKIAPGEVFSFNKAVGETTLASGYQIGYGISLVNGQTGTVPSVAGGICQVSTTVFQAAYWAGLAIVERYYHRYWIPRYGQPPSGRTGFDATVEAPGVDFRFKNTTDDWILLESWTDGANVHVVLRGADPGWEVESSRPAIANVVPADHTMVRQDDDTLPAGQELVVEHAEDGFDVSVERVVTKGGKLVNRYRFFNRYVPARDVMLVGTKGLTRTPTPSPAPAVPTPVPPTPTPSDPAAYKLASGRIRVPGLVGLPENDAKALIERVGLANTYSNYQGAGDVPENVLASVPPGHVLSQTPAPDSQVLPGTTVYIAVRKK